MFDKLKKAFSSAAKGIGQKEITEKLLDDTLLDLQIALLESDVAQEVTDDLAKKLKQELLGLKLEKGQDAEQIIRSKLQGTVAEIFARAGRFDLIEKIKAKKAAKAGPYVVVFLGINGTGKTTTVAKMGNLIRKAGLSVVVAAGDTHRAGAIEQLTEHANRLSLKVVAQRYGADPSAVGRDAVDHARKNYIDAVLIDTAGRMQTSKNLMDEMSKIVRVVKPDSRMFIGDALAGNDTINQAREFFQYANFDAAVLTKVDADAKGGAAISIIHITSKPIAYIGVGQGYDDVIPFDPDKFLESLFGSASEVSVHDLMSMPLPPRAEPVHEEPKPEKAVEEKKPEARKEEEKPPANVPAPAPAAASPIGIFAPKAEQKAEPKPQPAAAPSLPKPEPAPKPKPIVREPEPVREEKKKVEYVPPPPKPKEILPSPPQPKEIPAPPQQKVEEDQQPKEKKGRFGGLFKKKSDEDRRKEEEEKRRQEEELARQEEEERKQIEKEKEEKKKKRKEDKDDAGEEDKVIYLTDDDIEDLLK